MIALEKSHHRIINGLLVIFAVELIIYSTYEIYKRHQIGGQYTLQLDMQKLNQEKDRKALIDSLEQSKYAATGKDAYERIYSSKQKSVTDLIEQLALEAFPRGWRAKVEVEEFTKTLLLLRPEAGTPEVSVNDIGRFLLPVLQNSHNYLGNVAIYNKKHGCYLFFDKGTLNELKTNQTLDENSILQARYKGSSFTRYNAITIPYQENSGHIFIPVIVSGPIGSYECTMMLDTGASMTVISQKLALQTGTEDLNKVQTRDFSTAKGNLTCAIVERQVVLKDFDAKQMVAVTHDEDINLLGVDFFKAKEYIIDSHSKCMYVWSK
jgi:predicted aspartyl protease